MTAAITSPCISVCRMDEASGWCEGCLRTLDEIAVWSLLDEAERQAVCQQLGQRRVLWRQTKAAAGNDTGPNV
jgi:uncharacterized protein